MLACSEGEQINLLELGLTRAKELGLKLDSHSAHYHWQDVRADGNAREWYLADDIHRILGESVEVHGGKYCLGGEWSFVSHKNAPSTHQALLVGIRPIVEESREKQMEQLLREITEYFIVAENDNNRWTELDARAKALLAKPEGK